MGSPRARPAAAGDRDWVETFLAEHGADRVARRGELLRPLDHPMLIAELNGEPAGLLTYIPAPAEWEVLTVHATRQWQGVGTALLDTVAARAAAGGASRLWLITTNDNLDALRFYQRRGFRIRTIRPGAVDDARRTIKPDIPEVGDHGIPIRDEIELERGLLDGSAGSG